MIRLDRVTYFYPGAQRAAIDGIDMEVGHGELVLVAGESGSGKSTLIRSMNGLVPRFHGGRFAGRVEVDGRPTLEVAPRDLADRIGFVGQDPENHAVASAVEDDIAFALENLGFDSATMRKRVEEVLDALGIAALRGRRLDSLSGGERQRAAIASVLVTMPGHLLLDEPTSQLDPQSAEEVISSVLRLRDEIGVAVVLAEHRLERVLQYADRLAVMNGGIDLGRPADVLERSEIGPPIVKLGRALKWSPLPLNLRDARNRVRGLGLAALPELEDHATGETVASTRGLELALGGSPVLRGINLEVGRGEVLALMGRNGSGKTTLLKAIAGLLAPHRGKVLRPPAIALVPQNPETLLFRKSLAEEIAATLRGRRRAADIDSIAAEAEFFGVAHLLDRYPRDLSAGEKTRAAVAVAAAGDPALVLLDEPTRGLDEPGKQHLIGLLDTYRRQGRAVVLATHDVELAARAATRVVLLAEGEIVLDGPPRAALAASLTFSTQMNKVFGDPRILTVDDALAALRSRPDSAEPAAP